MLPVSADSIASHVVVGVGDEVPVRARVRSRPQGGRAYGSHAAGRPVASRTVFVIGKDGKVAWREMKFNALNEEAYASLAAAVAKAR